MYSTGADTRQARFLCGIQRDKRGAEMRECTHVVDEWRTGDSSFFAIIPFAEFPCTNAPRDIRHGAFSTPLPCAPLSLPPSRD